MSVIHFVPEVLDNSKVKFFQTKVDEMKPEKKQKSSFRRFFLILILVILSSKNLSVYDSSLNCHHKNENTDMIKKKQHE